MIVSAKQTLRFASTATNFLRPLSTSSIRTGTFTPRQHRFYSSNMGSQPEKNGLTSEEIVADLGFTPTIKVDDPWTVDKVVKEIPGGAPKEESSSPLPFFHMLERLKTTKREGWRRFGIDR